MQATFISHPTFSEVNNLELRGERLNDGLKCLKVYPWLLYTRNFHMTWHQFDSPERSRMEPILTTDGSQQQSATINSILRIFATRLNHGRIMVESWCNVYTVYSVHLTDPSILPVDAEWQAILTTSYNNLDARLSPNVRFGHPSHGQYCIVTTCYYYIVM